jgi:hypothetical protein
MNLDLNKLENKLDEALSNETSETLSKFFNDKRMTNNKQQTHTCVFEKSKTSNSNEAKCKYCNIVRYTIDVKFNNETYGDDKQ